MASLAEDRPGKIVVDVDAPDRQLLVISESYHTGWQSRIDGQAATIENVNSDFMGCVVEKGKHQVEFVFAPADLQFGENASLTFFSIVMGIALCGGVGCFRHRRSPRHDAGQ